jgi:hypothetical protein
MNPNRRTTMLQPFVLNLIASHEVIPNLSTRTEMLSVAEIAALDARFSENANTWLLDNAPSAHRESVGREVKRDTGRKPNAIVNPFFGFIGCMTDWTRYPAFASDIIEGVARLDWHGRDVDVGGKSMPLSVRAIGVILESLPIVTTEAVMDLLRMGDRHARRYRLAMEMIVSRMMDWRPRLLIAEMEGLEIEPGPCEWDDANDLITPSPEELAKLHYDLRTLTQFKTAEEYEAEEQIAGQASTRLGPAVTRQQHPKRPEVLRLLLCGTPVKAIERLTGVQPKTIRRWRELALTQAA